MSLIRRRGRRRKINTTFGLQLTSMLDILVILLVFMLKSMWASMHNFSSVPGLKMPLSKSSTTPPDSLNLIITPEAMTFEDDRIVEFIQTFESANSDEASYRFRRSDLDEGGRRVVALYSALIKERDKAEVLRAKSKARTKDGRPLPFIGTLAIQADKRISYDTLRKVMYTAGAADYKVFRFLALKDE